VTQQHLQTLQTHAGIEEFRGEGVTKRVNRVSPMIQPGFPDIAHEPVPGRAVAHPAPFAPAVEQILFARIPCFHPVPQGTEGIIAEIHNSPQPVLLPLVDLNPPLPEVDIRNPRMKQLPDPHPRPQ
jgi:hypothetical protein